ncbi:hypothetical protein BXZ70DRAFT_1003701 [Cristinia sonorae]|uniref:DUF3074 domain-containing protein n=1 Tax=Cristinia sonorae TaxID=1940300 RepID=A0A8K0UY75_9AGAR|nr:hypothetical protein BXZ70DRAFT_1003701 [Cristinia sonorae]
MANKKFQLSITPLKLSQIPSEETIVQVGRELIESTNSWKQGKTFVHGSVHTLYQPKGTFEPAGWHCRLSEHTPEEATFDDFWTKLGENKAENEKNYVPDIKKVTLIKELSPTQSIWSLYYTFPPPVSPRIFTVLQTMHLDPNSPRTGMIISIPIDLSSPEDAELAKHEEKGVKGRYTSVERLMELPNGKVEWRMATCSTPGGSIPQFVAERTMPGKISDDVPHFLRWLHAGKAKANGTASAATPTPKKRLSFLGALSPTSSRVTPASPTTEVPAAITE